jgi:hypothetical protein
VTHLQAKATDSESAQAQAHAAQLHALRARHNVKRDCFPLRHLLYQAADGNLALDTPSGQTIELTLEEQSNLIESILLGRFVPEFVFWKQVDGTVRLLGGRQRLVAIQAFAAGDLRLCLGPESPFCGAAFADLCSEARYAFLNYGVGIVELPTTTTEAEIRQHDWTSQPAARPAQVA